MRNIPAAAKAVASGGSSKKTQCCSKVGMKRGTWTPEEDALLADYVRREGEGRWRMLPKKAGLLRCGKSCRLRWMNYLRPSVKRGQIAPDEEDMILRLHRLLGNRWSLIAGRIPGRTDNEIKNYWNTHLSKKLISQGIDPRTHKPLQEDKHTATPPTPNPNPNSVSASGGQHPILLISGDNLMPAHFSNYTAVPNIVPSFDHAAADCETSHRDHMRAQEGPSTGGLMATMTTADGDDAYNIGEVNYVHDDDENVFSSFLNSLINEDAFISNHVLEAFDPPPICAEDDKETRKSCSNDRFHAPF